MQNTFTKEELASTYTYGQYKRIYMPSCGSIADLERKGHHKFEYRTGPFRMFNDEPVAINYAKCVYCERIFVEANVPLNRKFYNIRREYEVECDANKDKETKNAVSLSSTNYFMSNISSHNSQGSNQANKKDGSHNNERQKLYIGNPSEFGCIGEKEHDLIDKTKMVKDTDSNRYYSHCWHICRTCGKAIFTPETKTDTLLYKKNSKYDLVFPKNNNLAEDEGSSSTVHELTVDNILTRQTVSYCIRNNHGLKQIRAAAEVITQSGGIKRVYFPAMYCEACEDYYIYEREYRKLAKKGILLCRVVEQSYWKNSNSYAGRREQSLLNMLGYNVNANVGLTAEQRRTLLLVIIENNLMSAFQIIDFLEGLCREREYMERYEAAIEKWESDIHYLQDLMINDEIPPIKVGTIVHKKPYD